MDRSLEHPRDSKEALLAAFAGILPVIPNASGQRETLYLAKIQGQDVQLPETDWTRTEMYLREIAEHGGGGSPVRKIEFVGNDENSIVVPELIGKTLFSVILDANMYSSAVSSYESIVLSIHPSNLGYTSLRFRPTNNSLTLALSGFNSDTGRLSVLDSIFPLERPYVAYYQ